MNKKFTFRDIAHSKVMQDYAEEQLAKIEDFLKNERSPITIDVIFQPSKVHAHHRIDLLIKSPHYDLMTYDEGPDFYGVLDSVFDTAYRRLHEEKDRHLEDKKMVGRHEEFKKQR